MSKIIGSIINDCADDHARARQELRFKALFGVQPTFVGVASYSPIEAAGNLVDQLDVLVNFPLADKQSEHIILVNVAPRGEDIAARWDNGIPFYYAKIGKVLLVGTYEEQCLALLRDLGVADRVELLDTADVTRAAIAWGDLSTNQAERIKNSQFRSLEFLPLVAYWVQQGRPVPSQSRSLKDLPSTKKQVWSIDNFGNAKTTILPGNIGFRPGKKVMLSNGAEATCYHRLADVPQGVTALTVGSSGYANERFLEVVIGHRGNAAQTHNLTVGTPAVG